MIKFDVRIGTANEPNWIRGLTIDQIGSISVRHVIQKLDAMRDEAQKEDVPRPIGMTVKQGMIEIEVNIVEST